MRCLFGFLCVCALTVMPLVGCSETTGVGGSGGEGGTGWSGTSCRGLGGTDITPRCESAEDCADLRECTTAACADGVCEHVAVEDSTPCGALDISDGVNLLGDDADWVDPFIGFRSETKLSDDGVWKAVVRADVGGGGFGEASRVACRYVGLLQYKPWKRTAVLLGWNHLANDWQQGSGSSKAAWNLRLSGPVIAMVFEF